MFDKKNKYIKTHTTDYAYFTYELSKHGNDYMSKIKPLTTGMNKIICTKENLSRRKILFLQVYQPYISTASAALR